MQQKQPDPVALYEQAVTNTRKIFANVKPAQMKDSTPCDKWDVAALMNHITGVSGYGINVLAGAQANDADHDAAKGGTTLEAFDKARNRFVQRAREPGALTKMVKGPAGDMPAAVFVGIIFNDMLVHGWDLAKATKQDTTLPKDLVETDYAMVSPNFKNLPRGEKAPFKEAVSVPATASTQTKLLAGYGRHA